MPCTLRTRSAHSLRFVIGLCPSRRREPTLARAWQPGGGWESRAGPLGDKGLITTGCRVLLGAGGHTAPLAFRRVFRSGAQNGLWPTHGGLELAIMGINHGPDAPTTIPHPPLPGRRHFAQFHTLLGCQRQRRSCRVGGAGPTGISDHRLRSASSRPENQASGFAASPMGRINWRINAYHSD